MKQQKSFEKQKEILKNAARKAIEKKLPSKVEIILKVQKSALTDPPLKKSATKPAKPETRSHKRTPTQPETKIKITDAKHKAPKKEQSKKHHTKPEPKHPSPVKKIHTSPKVEKKSPAKEVKARSSTKVET